MARFVVAALFSTLLGCGDGNPAAPDPVVQPAAPAAAGAVLSATMNGAPWEARVVRAYHAAPGITLVEGGGQGWTVGLMVPEVVGVHRVQPNFNGPSTFVDVYWAPQDGLPHQANWKSPFIDSNDKGFVSVDRITADSIEGTFSVEPEWYNGVLAPYRLVMANGRFRVTAYCQGVKPAC
ncbi:MAG: hypothetical protein HOP14_13345 [Acidobacteria bacterium]|nr:hypothetical protein [Acidobacteriota bacterium]